MSRLIRVRSTRCLGGKDHSISAISVCGGEIDKLSSSQTLGGFHLTNLELWNTKKSFSSGTSSFAHLSSASYSPFSILSLRMLFGTLGHRGRFMSLKWTKRHLEDWC